MSEPVLDDAVRSLRRVILAGEHYRQSVAQVTGLGVTETQALSYLAVHGPRGQNELAADLGITSSAATALVDRLERQGVAERSAHPSDRRRVQVQLTEGGRAVVKLSRDWLASAFDDLPEATVKELSCELVRIADSLRAASLKMLDARD
ncbi:MAG TPA: MarR family transcriptional regulator [Microlunatus sp.]|nr:MarR family transcriptional regulator [Microlunatus sp.]